MARNAQLIRQHKILEILERYRFGKTLEELRDEVVDDLGLASLHARSIRRDLEALRAAGLDIQQQSSPRGKRWRLGPRVKSVHKIQVSASELISLSMGRDLLYPLAGTPFWHGIESFWNKTRDQLPEGVWKHYQRYRQTLLVRGSSAKSYQAHHGVLSTLHRAILEHRVTDIQYQSIGKDPARRKIEPYAVVFYQSSLYIIAADHERPADDPQRIRHWKLDRFQKAQTLDQWFTPDPDFDLEEHLGKSLGIFSANKARTYRLRVSSYASRWILEDPWHPEQQIQRHADGSIILTLSAAHDLEIIPRVLALAGEAEVLSPKSCREALANIVAKLASQYDGAAD